MPYSLRGTSVVKSGSGEVVKKHPSREKALAHLRALKANVEEAVLCECGAPARGHVCQRGHRVPTELREDWASFDASRKGMTFHPTTPGFQHSEAYAVHRHGKPTGERLLRRKTDGSWSWSHGQRGMPTERVPHDAVMKMLRGSLSEAWSPQARAAALAARHAHGGGKPAWDGNWDKAPGGKRYEVNHQGHHLQVVKQNTAAGGPRWKAYHTPPAGPTRIVAKGDQFTAVKQAATDHFHQVLQGPSGFKPRPVQELAQRGR